MSQHMYVISCIHVTINTEFVIKRLLLIHAFNYFIDRFNTYYYIILYNMYIINRNISIEENLDS